LTAAHEGWRALAAKQAAVKPAVSAVSAAEHCLAVPYAAPAAVAAHEPAAVAEHEPVAVAEHEPAVVTAPDEPPDAPEELDEVAAVPDAGTAAAHAAPVSFPCLAPAGSPERLGRVHLRATPRPTLAVPAA
jgi:hypothetical protein